MRILHVIPTLDPLAGGPPMIALRLAAAQAGLGHEVHIVCYPSRDEGKARIAEEVRKIPFVDRVHIHSPGPWTMREHFFAMAVDRTLRELMPRMDALHLHGVWETMLVRAARHARRLGVPYLVLTSGMLEPWALARRRIKKRFALAVAARSMLNGAKAIHLGNPGEAEAMKNAGVHAPGVVIPNGVFLEELQPLPPIGSFRARHPEIADKPFVLFLGRLDAQKGVDLLVPAFEIALGQKPELRLVIAGPDYGMASTLRRQIEGANLGEKIFVVGALHGFDKLAAFVDAACFCLPSRHEGFSLAIVEALAAGLPVVISDQCHFPEIATTGAGEVAPLDPAAIAASLLRVTDPARRAAAGEAAMKYVSENLTWGRIARRTIEVYRDQKVEKVEGE
jgi:glycosyltransferase involved in cell wall biosynthesis